MFCVQKHNATFSHQQINLIQKTVAALLRCTENDIFVRKTKYHRYNSDIVVFIKQAYLRNLIGLREHDKKKLMELNIECLIADPVTVFLNHKKGKGN